MLKIDARKIKCPAVSSLQLRECCKEYEQFVKMACPPLESQAQPQNVHKHKHNVCVHHNFVQELIALLDGNIH